MNMTMILLTVSVGCNLWFLFLLLYEQHHGHADLSASSRGIAGLWRSLGGHEAQSPIAAHEVTPPAETPGGHHRQEPFQDGIHPDNRCHTDARSRHYWKKALS